MINEVAWIGSYEIWVLAKLIIALLLGGFLGYQREKRNKWAGLRTHVLVCLGSCLIMITSLDLARLFPDRTMDPGRIAAQVVSGIGFLGAGTILHSPSQIKGLTTAATLWFMAGVGLAVGAGMFFSAIAATVIAYFVLGSMQRLEWKVKKQLTRYRQIEFETRDVPKGLEQASRILKTQQLEILRLTPETLGEGWIRILMEVELPVEIDMETLQKMGLLLEDIRNYKVL
jgi:putative Mg2+ transporter-C (MgtC) family protein